MPSSLGLGPWSLEVESGLGIFVSRAEMESLFFVVMMDADDDDETWAYWSSFGGSGGPLSPPRNLNAIIKEKQLNIHFRLFHSISHAF